MKDWVTVLIILLILGVLFDGMRRMRAHRRNHLRMQRKVVQQADMTAEEPVENLTVGEFPSGGARVAAYRDSEHLDTAKTAKSGPVVTRTGRPVTHRSPEQTSLKLDASVPMLMDSVDAHREHDVDPQMGNLNTLDDEALESNKVHTRAKRLGDDAPKESINSKESIKGKEVEKPKDVDNRRPDMVMVVNVMAAPDQVFAGPQLLDALVNQGMRYGDMDIFHRHEAADGRGRILFSAANIVVPGTFDLIAMDDFSSPGISFFLTLPIASDSLSAYNLMLETAQAVAEDLNGEVRDENRIVMTRQTMEHERQRVLEYERKRRLTKH